jgi:hypothetical protein
MVQKSTRRNRFVGLIGYDRNECGLHSFGLYIGYYWFSKDFDWIYNFNKSIFGMVKPFQRKTNLLTQNKESNTKNPVWIIRPSR